MNPEKPENRSPPPVRAGESLPPGAGGELDAAAGSLTPGPDAADLASRDRQLDRWLESWEPFSAGGLETPEATLAGVRRRLRRTARHRMLVVAAAVAVVAAAGAIEFLTTLGRRGPGDGVELGRPAPDAAAPPARELLDDLDILEALEEEGVDLSMEVVDRLLESELPDTGPLDPALFDDWLEEELAGGNL